MPVALVSVHDKTGLAELGRGLADLGWTIVSSGGTARALTAAGVAVTPVEDVTGFPEMLDGRVKTLHPRIHAGILADRSRPEHVATLTDHGIEPIDLVVCNLYPFRSDPSVELIDVGGPTMVRAAAKNHDAVTVVVDPADHEGVLAELRDTDTVSAPTRRRLAAVAFAHTAAYDAAIADWLAGDGAAGLPDRLRIDAVRSQELRYGENPHQTGARYRFEGGTSWWDGAVQHGGKQLSYLNLYDTEAAWRLVHELGDRPAAVVVKHANPCGAAVADDLATAYRRAHEGDPTSAFGGIVACNREVDVEVAEALAPVFTEVVVAPGYADDALAVLTARKNLRVLSAPAPGTDRWQIRSIDGGLLVQEADPVSTDRSSWRVVSERHPTDAEWDDLALAWVLAARTTSNTIVLVAGGQAVGIGAGQQSRVDAARIAAGKAAGRAEGGAGASDAFFPFRDGLDAVVDAGVAAVVQPGGSVRDDEVIAAADERGVALVLTGERHFRH